MDEIEIVRRIFRLYVIGDEANGPLSVPKITEVLNQDGVRWLEDFDKYNRTRKKSGRFEIHHTTIYNLLSDCCYVGRQRHKGDEYPCPAFLIDGKPAVEEWLYEAAQEKRGLNRMVHSKHTSAPCTGRIVCGVCGIAMRKHRSTDGFNPDGSRRVVEAWRTIGVRTGFPLKCPHDLPVIWVERLTQYVRDHLCRELAGELHRLAVSADREQVANRRASLGRELQEACRKMDEELPRYAMSVSPELVAKIERQLRDDIGSLRAQVRQLDDEMAGAERLHARLTDLAEAPDAVVRETVDRVIHWAAVLPGNPGSDAHVGGRIVFCTRWGTLHTAVVYREPKHKSARVHNSWRLRRAEVIETVGSVAEFPQPGKFVEQIRHTYTVAERPFDPLNVAPGYEIQQEVPTFSVE